MRPAKPSERIAARAAAARRLEGSAPSQTMSVVDKVMVGAQVISSLVLAITVVFVYFGWQEARDARIAQAEYFVAEKAPMLDFKGVVIKDGSVVAEVENAGDSAARNVVVIAEVQKTNGSRVRLRDEPREIGTIHRRQSASIDLASSSSVEAVLQYQPGAFERVDPYRHSNDSPAGDVFLLVTYDDAAGMDYSAVFRFRAHLSTKR